MKASQLLLLPGLLFHPIRLKHRIKNCIHDSWMRICRIKTIHISVILLPCVGAEREKEWRAKERKRQMFVEGRKQKATEPLRDFRGLQILLLLLTFQSGHESRMISCHFSLTLLLLLGTETWQLSHSHSPPLPYCPRSVSLRILASL